MNRSTDQFDELGRLTAALCDGQITPEEAARLEQLANRSSQARQFFLRYVQLHGELNWENAASAAKKRAVWSSRRMIAMATAASLLVAVLLGVASSRRWWRGSPEPSPPATVARVTRTIDAEWSDGGPNLEGTPLPVGRRLDLRRGLAEVRFRSQARLILEGPAILDVDGPNGGFLRAGKLTANVPEAAAGFAVRTPSATVVDRGTEFGVMVEDSGETEVHVFAGTVAVRPDAALADARPWRQVHTGEAVRALTPAGSATPEVRSLDLDSSRFVRNLPIPGSVAALRALVARHANLIHHYTFEGVTEGEKRRDKRGDLDLVEVVMHGGRGGGELDYSASGIDATTNAVHPYRARRNGNAIGVSLQSEHEFEPTQAMTVELLLSFEGFPGSAEGEISAAVATRQDERDCGFFVVAADRGCLVHLMDADSPWTEGGLELNPGEWYYVASTFLAGKTETTVNTYVANLSRPDRSLRHVVRDQAAVGVPAASRLGIGKGFARNIAHAYPWHGRLDEVAVYDAVLDQETLEKHWESLMARGD